MSDAAAVPLVRVRDVFKIYREGEVETVALRGTDLDLARGSVTSLIGPSGSGKSTLLALIAGLAVPSAGQVILDGQDIGRLDEAARSRIRGRRIGIVFQSGNLIPFLTARENVRAAMAFGGAPSSASRAAALLEAVGVSDRTEHYPRQLSGGEAQRVALAVALANEPDVLLADELTGELDSATAGRVLDVLERLWTRRSLTVLLVTHDPLVAARADTRLAVIDGVVAAA
ncbi:MAG TPA: ABC transporter ATP-binding protein [Candidatus Limnocylindria bacterium]|nr:ABC transporter ATP-binding protein [Candidatus Limnocylindria bacterium]